LSEERYDPLAVLDELLKEREQELSIEPLKNVDFLQQRCSGCGDKMTIGKGDTLYAGRWYHRSCWAARRGTAQTKKPN
jgi:hypothetical protein